MSLPIKSTNLFRGLHCCHLTFHKFSRIVIQQNQWIKRTNFEVKFYEMFVDFNFISQELMWKFKFILYSLTNSWFDTFRIHNWNFHQIITPTPPNERDEFQVIKFNILQQNLNLMIFTGVRIALKWKQQVRREFYYCYIFLSIVEWKCDSKCDKFCKEFLHCSK